MVVDNEQTDSVKVMKEELSERVEEESISTTKNKQKNIDEIQIIEEDRFNYNIEDF